MQHIGVITALAQWLCMHIIQLRQLSVLYVHLHDAAVCVACFVACRLACFVPSPLQPQLNYLHGASLSCRVKDVMTATPITVRPETGLEEAAT